MKKLIIISCFICFYSCSICKKKIGIHALEFNKKNLACNCNSIKRDTVITKKIWEIEQRKSLYIIGKVLTDGSKNGIYQYFTTGTSRSERNEFIFYNKGRVSILNKDSLKPFHDSLINLGFSKKKVTKRMATVKKRMDIPAWNTSDSF